MLTTTADGKTIPGECASQWSQALVLSSYYHHGPEFSLNRNKCRCSLNAWSRLIGSSENFRMNKVRLWHIKKTNWAKDTIHISPSPFYAVSPLMFLWLQFSPFIDLEQSLSIGPILNCLNLFLPFSFYQCLLCQRSFCLSLTSPIRCKRVVSNSLYFSM